MGAVLSEQSLQGWPRVHPAFLLDCLLPGKNEGRTFYVTQQFLLAVPHPYLPALHRRISSRKWIGTTEAAALLRYFGLRACIIDFGTQHGQQVQLVQQQQQLGGGAAAAAPAAPGGGGGPTEVHANVQCDGCGRCPVIGAHGERPLKE